MTNKFLDLYLLLLLFIVSCSKDNQNDSASTGEVIFWVSSDFGCGNITVNCNGLSRQITGYYSSGTPDCAGSWGAKFTLDPGTYNFSASCTGKTWSGTIIITAGNCSAMQLTNSGGGTGGGGTGGGGTGDCNSGWNQNLVQILNAQWINSTCSNGNNRTLRVQVKNISTQFIWAYIGAEESNGNYGCGRYWLSPGETIYSYHCSISGRYKWNARLGSSTICSTCPW